MVAIYIILMPRDLVGLLDICSQKDQSSHFQASVKASVPPSVSAARVSVDAPDNLPLAARLGDWIELDVDSIHAGVVTVHGLARDEYEIPGAGLIRVRFKATQLGRYPVHFHSAKGEHAPLAYVDVLPR